MNETLERLIVQNCPWVKLPANAKEFLSHSVGEYERLIVEVSIKHQLRFRDNLVQRIRRDEQSYYEQLISYSRRHLMLYPYHLSDIVVKGLRLTPFQYYLNIVRDTLLAERSYDSLPNFTAADCLRLLGVGRNQYIDLMNQCKRSERVRSGFRKRVVSLPQLPSQPLPTVMLLPNWRVDVGQVMEEDVKFLSQAERSVIDCLIDKKLQLVGRFDRDVIRSLYTKGLVYIDIPVEDTDCFAVPPLEGFVMNRVLGDFFEKLLYKIFVSIDETISIGELATLLQIDSSLVKNAVSVFCRLGFACNKTVPPADHHVSWNEHQVTVEPPTSPTTRSNNDSDLVDDPWITQLKQALSTQSLSTKTSAQTCTEPSVCHSENVSSRSTQQQRVALLYDWSLTAYLMMGNLSTGLKQHAVTMFEVGKLPDEALASLLCELDNMDTVQCEGEAGRYLEHAMALRHAIQSIRCSNQLMQLPMDLVRYESLKGLDSQTYCRLLKRNYRVMVSMSPLSMELNQLPVWNTVPPHFGPPSAAVNSLWFRLYIYHLTGSGPPSFMLVRGTCLTRLPFALWRFDRLLVTSWGHNSVSIPTFTALLTINEALTHSSVLVQGLGWVGDGCTHSASFPGQLAAAERLCPTVGRLRSHLKLDDSCGFIRLLKISRSADEEVPAEVNDSPCAVPIRCACSHLSGCERPVPNIGRHTASVESAVESPVLGTQSARLFDKTHPGEESVLSLIRLGPKNGVCSDEARAPLMEKAEASCRSQLTSTGSESRLEDSLENNTLPDPNDLGEERQLLDGDVSEMLDKHQSSESIKEGNSDRTQVSSSREHWVLFECNLGLPLFDLKLCRQVTNALSTGNAFSGDRLERLGEFNRRLAHDLNVFIGNCQSRWNGETCRKTVSAEDSTVEPPTVCLAFVGGVLYQIDDF